MGITLTLSALFAPFQLLFSRHFERQVTSVARRPMRGHRMRWPMSGSPGRRMVVGAGATKSGLVGEAPVAPVTRPRPLHVIRCMEADMPAGSSGRMVISGRLADVCAELDRLAASEARQEKSADCLARGACCTMDACTY